MMFAGPKPPRRSARRKKTVNIVAILCNYIITSQKYFTRNSHCERSVFLASQPHNMPRFTVRVWGIRSNITWNVRGAARLRISRRTSRALRIQQLKRSFIPQEVCLFFLLLQSPLSSFPGRRSASCPVSRSHFTSMAFPSDYLIY